VDAALGIAKELLVDEPTDCEFKVLLDDCERLLKEQRGEYDLQSMRKDLAAKKCDTFRADFVSPKAALGVDISYSSGGTYRGCKAVRDIDENELICASKAFVFVQSNDDCTMQVDVYSKRIREASRIKACAETIAQLYNRPSLGHQLYSLSAGPAFQEVAHENIEKIDISRIEGILSANVFAAHNESLGAKVAWERCKKVQVLERPLTQSEHDELNKEVGRGSGLWIKESMFNHSCAPNCIWSQIGDHMFIRSTRPISSGEELCITYVGNKETYEAKKAKFAGWIGQHDGFECQCEWCYAMRTDSELCKITKTVEAVYANAAKQVTSQRLPMWQAANNVLPLAKRLGLLSQFKQYPLRLQHCAGAQLRIMHGTCISHAGNKAGALAMYEEAAAIMYAVRGSSGMDRSQDLWRIAGAALKCQNTLKAMEALTGAWANPEFAAFSSDVEARQAFVDLTSKYTLPWYDDRQPSSCTINMIESLAWDVCESKSSIPKVLKGSKGRKGKVAKRK
jgi:hypothetical protein